MLDDYLRRQNLTKKFCYVKSFESLRLAEGVLGVPAAVE
jgi:hypothetical protein